MPRLRALPMLMALLLTFTAVAQTPAKKEVELTAEQKRLLVEADELREEAERLFGRGQREEAFQAFRKRIDRVAKARGEQSEAVIKELGFLDRVYAKLSMYDESEEVRNRVVAIQTKRFGEKDWRTTDARLDVAAVKMRRGLSEAQGETLDAAYRTFRDAERLADLRKFDEAAILYRESLTKLKATSGDKDPDYALIANNLAAAYRKAHDLRAAEDEIRTVLALSKDIFGEEHPRFAKFLDHYAEVLEDLGRNVEAEAAYQKSLSLRKTCSGEESVLYALGLMSLGNFYLTTGRYAEAEVVCRRTEGLCRTVYGPTHPDYASSLSNLAAVYKLTGRPSEAMPLLSRAVLIRSVHREEYPLDYAQTLMNSAGCRLDLKELSTADYLYTQAREIIGQLPGKRGSEYISSVNNLALVYHERHKTEEAVALLKEAIALQGGISKSSPQYAKYLLNLARIRIDQEDYKEAEPLLRQGVELRKQSFGEAHHDYAWAVTDLGRFYALTGRHDEAETELLRSVRLIADHADRNSIGQSESAQLALSASVRSFLENLLEGIPKSDPAKIHDAVLRLRGSVTQRQVFLRSVRNADPKLQPLIEALQKTTAEMSRLESAPFDPANKIDRPAEMARLETERQEQEAELATKSDAFAAYQTRKRRTTADIQKAIPDNGVLVEFLQYGPKLCAFVLDRKQVRRVELGEMKPIADAVEAFRDRIIGRDPNDPDRGKGVPALKVEEKPPTPVLKPVDPAMVLRQKLWEPVAKLIGDAKVVLVSPDGALCRLPFAALPGSKEGSYLIEELAIVTVPVPSMLPDLIAPLDPDPRPTMLAVGEIDFGKLPEVKDPLAPDRGEWSDLPGTAGEVTKITETFRRARPDAPLAELRKGKASKEAMQAEASKATFLHIATHGFFAPAGYGQLAGNDPKRERFDAAGKSGSVVNPGLLSGLVFAGANRPALGNDGILTALEVSELDLSRAELVVLSACETGLGNTAGGEGVMGLQRAFHIAGARTAVTSLWKVDDKATEALMGRFYANLFEKKMGKLDALIEAQKWVMIEGPKAGFTRGMKIVPQKDAKQPAVERAGPFYWAAFSLSGDWR